MRQRITRRRMLATTAVASALPLVHIRTAGAAGKLSCAFWDHWVPAGNDAMRKVVGAWAEKNKVDVQLDFLTAIGNKIDMTMGAEAVAKTGHDIFAFDIWTVPQWHEQLTPVDDVMASLIKQVRAHRAGKRVSGEDRRALGCGADLFRQRAADALRAHQHVQAVCRHRRAGVVSGT